MTQRRTNRQRAYTDPIADVPERISSRSKLGASIPRDWLSGVEAAVRHNPDHVASLPLQALPSAIGDPPGPHASMLCVVPTARSLTVPPPGLELAVDIGRQLGIETLVLCSRNAYAHDAPEDWQRPGSGVTLIDFGSVAKTWLPAPSTDGRLPSNYDVADKRNVGLAVAVHAGVDQVLFLDDDVYPVPDANLDAFGVARTSDWMQEKNLAVSGWLCRDFPDNSSVCHARRLAGFPQGVFIGAGAMIVRIDGDVPFFPDQYNEDWLFTIEAARRSRRFFGAVGIAGQMGQEAYDPYARARVNHQEIADLFAECVLHAHELGRPKLLNQGSFWRKSLARRRDMLTDIETGLRKQKARGTLPLQELNTIPAALTAIRWAGALLEQTSSEALVYLWTEWRRELARWDSHLTTIRRHHHSNTGLSSALQRLAAGLGPEISDRTLRRATDKTGEIPQVGSGVPS